MKRGEGLAGETAMGPEAKLASIGKFRTLQKNRAGGRRHDSTLLATPPPFQERRPTLTRLEALVARRYDSTLLSTSPPLQARRPSLTRLGVLAAQLAAAVRPEHF